MKQSVHERALPSQVCGCVVTELQSTQNKTYLQLEVVTDNSTVITGHFKIFQK